MSFLACHDDKKSSGVGFRDYAYFQLQLMLAFCHRNKSFNLEAAGPKSEQNQVGSSETQVEARGAICGRMMQSAPDEGEGGERQGTRISFGVLTALNYFGKE